MEYLNHPYVIPSMSSEETCLQGFPNDDIFGVIAFALVQIKAVGLRKMRTITVERQRGNQGEAAFRYAGLPRRNSVAPRNDKWKIDLKSSACAHSAPHQADNLAKLRLDYLSVF